MQPCIYLWNTLQSCGRTHHIISYCKHWRKSLQNLHNCSLSMAIWSSQNQEILTYPFIYDLFHLHNLDHHIFPTAVWLSLITQAWPGSLLLESFFFIESLNHSWETQFVISHIKYFYNFIFQCQLSILHLFNITYPASETLLCLQFICNEKHIWKLWFFYLVQ